MTHEGWWPSTATSLALHAQDRGFQCQMVQLILKGSLLISKKLTPNKSPFIAMPVSSHAEVLKHLGPGHCLLNLTGPSAIAFQ